MILVGFGPKLLAEFAGGRFEECIAGRSLTLSQMRESGISLRIAELTASLHVQSVGSALPVPSLRALSSDLTSKDIAQSDSKDDAKDKVHARKDDKDTHKANDAKHSKSDVDDKEEASMYISREPSLFVKLKEWLARAKSVRFAVPSDVGDELSPQQKDQVRKQAILDSFHLQSNVIDRELEWLHDLLAPFESPVTFCHNDLQIGNILLLQPRTFLNFLL